MLLMQVKPKESAHLHNSAIGVHQWYLYEKLHVQMIPLQYGYAAIVPLLSIHNWKYIDIPCLHPRT